MDKQLGFNQAESREGGFGERTIMGRDATAKGSMPSGKKRKSFCNSGAESGSRGTGQHRRLRRKTFCSEPSSVRFYLRHPRISHQNFKKGVTWLDLHFPRPLWLPVEDGMGWGRVWSKGSISRRTNRKRVGRDWTISFWSVVYYFTPSPLPNSFPVQFPDFDGTWKHVILCDFPWSKKTVK